MAKIYKQNNTLFDKVLDFFNTHQYIAGEIVRTPTIEESQAQHKVATDALKSVAKAVQDVAEFNYKAQVATEEANRAAQQQVLNATSNVLKDFAEFNMQAQISAGVIPDVTKPQTVGVQMIGGEVRPIFVDAPEPEVKTEEPKRPTNFEEEMEEGGWYEAIVDNTNVQSGTRLNDYGYLTVHCDDAQDGEYVLVNSEGTVQLIEQMELSEDKRKKVDEFKTKFSSARTQYDIYLELQKLAKRAENRINVDLDNPHQVNSIVDILINSFHAYADLNTYGYNERGEKQSDKNLLDITSPVAQSWQEYGAHTVSGRNLMNLEIESKYGADWKERYSGSQEALEEFLALKEDSMLKEYMAYQLVTNDKAIGLAHVGMRAIGELAEVGDAFAGAIKAGTTPGVYEDESYIERLAAAYAPTYSETGRRNYEYDTGSAWMDLALEVVSDPTFILTTGAKGLAKIGTGSLDDVIKNIVKQSADDIVEETATQTAKQVAPGLSKRALKQTIWKGVKEGVDNRELATSILARVMKTPTDEAITTLEKALDYSNALNLSRSLKGMSDAKEAVEDLLMMPVIGPSRLFVQKTVAGVQFIKTKHALKAMEAEELTAKAMRDAHLETTGDASKEITIGNVEEYIQNLDKNILGINIDGKGKVLNNLSREARVRTIADANINACNNIDVAITDLLKSPNLVIEDIPGSLSHVIQFITDGKCATLEEYISEVLRILKDNDLYDDAIVARLESTRRLYNRATTRQANDTIFELYQRIRKIRGQYFETIRTITFKKPEFGRYKKFKDAVSEAGEELVSFKEFYKTPIVQDRLMKYRRVLDEYAPDEPVSFEVFFENLKAQDGYEPLYKRELDELYSTYTTSVYKANEARRQAIYEEVVAHNKAAKANNQKVYEESLALYKSYRTAIWEAHKKSTDKANAILFEKAYNSYLEELDMRMRMVYQDAITNNNLFPSDAFMQSELARVQTLLEKDILSFEEWQDIYDTVDRAIKVSQENEYIRLGVGTTELPYTENLVNLGVVKSTRVNYAKALKDTGMMRTVKDFGSMSQVQGALYEAKLNKVVEANTIITNPKVSRAYADVLNGGEFGQAVIEIAQTKSPRSKLQRATAAFIDDAYSAQRYTRIVNAVDEAVNVPNEIKNALIDKLFTLDKRTRSIFKRNKSFITNNYSGITKELIDSSARRVAKEWISEAMRHIAKSNDDLSNMYTKLKCNEPDTLANVRNIQEQFDKWCTEQDPHEAYVFYSVRFHGGSGGLEEFSLRTVDGYEWTIKGNPYGSILDQQSTYAEIGREIERLRAGDALAQGAGSKGKNLKFVGFNNHATGFDTDHHLHSQRFHLGNTSVHLGSTIDVAEQLRIRDGLPIVPQAAYAELEEILSDVFLRWYSDTHHTMCDLSLSVVPSVTGKSKFTFLLDGLRNYQNPTDHAIIQRFQEIDRAIRSSQITITRYNNYLAESGLIYAEHYTNIMPTLGRIFGNKESSIIASKKLYDDNAISRYFDKALADGTHASELYEFAHACDKTLSRIADYEILDKFAVQINTAFRRLSMHDSVTRKWLDKQGMVFKNADLLSTPERYAVLHNVYISMGLKDAKALAKLAGGEDVVKLIYEAKSIVFGDGKVANVYENLSGSVVRDSSMLHSSNTILAHAEKVQQQLAKWTPTIQAQELALRSAGLTGSLEYAQVQAKANAARKLTEYIEDIKASVHADNEAKTLEFLDAHDNSTLAYRQLMLGTSTEYTVFNKAMYEFSKWRDNFRLTYISMQDGDDIVRHLIKDCNGRMLLHKESCDLHTINTILEKIKDMPHVKYDENSGFIRVWYSASELSEAEIDLIIQDLSNFSLPALHHTGVDLESKFGKDSRILHYIEQDLKMIEDLAEYGPNNLTYGMFTVNTPDLAHKIDNRFFDDIEEDLLDIGTLNALGNFKGQAMCTYHGDISLLSREGMFLSNNQFTNICNMYGHVINSLDSTQDLLNVIFHESNQFAAVVETFKALDGVHGVKGLAETLQAQGYVAVALTGDAAGHLKLHSLDIANPKVYNAAMKNRYTTIMRYDTFRELQNQLELKNLAVGSSGTTNELLRRVQDAASWYNARIRYPFIQSMLFMKPATWMRNIPDSVAKALAKEGTEYLQYIPEAVKTLDAYKTIEDAIYDAYRKIDPLTINRYFDAHPESPMTKDMFTMLRSYWKNPVSGTQAENLVKMFNIDPTSIFKHYTDLGLVKKDYEYVLEVFKKYDNPEVPMYRRMSQINAELRELYDSSVASKLTSVYQNSYAKLSVYTKGGSFLDKIPVLNKWLNFNAERFNDVETINRLAIFLKRMESGDNMGQALKAIGETQFDYSKSDFMKAVELIAPFSTFKLYNYQFWLDTVWNYNIIEYLGDVAKVFMPEDNSDDYWSDENMSYRALVNAYLDTLEEKTPYEEYDSFRDYNGTKAMDAFEYGWLRIGDKLYLKINASFIDALKLTHAIGNPSEFTSLIEDSIFAPFSSVMNLCKDFFELEDSSKAEMISSVSKIITQLNMSDHAKQAALESVAQMDVYNPYDIQDAVLSAYILDHAYDLTNMFPVLGSIYYSMYSTGRNYNKAIRDGEVTAEEVFTFIPSLFAPAKDETYNKYAESYYAKPVGFDWYNQTEEYRKTHRYVVGVSYVPAHVNKDPATYIDTWGRMHQLGIPKEALPELFENGKNWWFTKDDYGNYKLHNYQLIIKDKTAYLEIYSTLIKYGWTPEQAEQLMNEVSISPWGYKTSTGGDTSGVTGYGQYSKVNVRGVLNNALYNSRAVTNQAKYNMAKYSGDGKWAQYDTLPKTYRQRQLYVKGHDVSRLSKKYQTAYRWHRRTRDIYRDNYAKYGASRMAMEQNLRAYSNRSITEMRRTNQNIRYARIHNRWWAT